MQERIRNHTPMYLENMQERIYKLCRNVFRKHAGMDLENLPEWI